MNDTVNDTEISPEQMDELRVEVRALMTAEGLSQAAAAKAADIAYATFSAWLGGTYAGNNGRVAGDARRWVDATADRKRAAVAIVAPPGYQTTQTAAEFLAAFQYAQVAARFSLIVGGAGVGKTTALERYRDTTPHVWLATMEPLTARPAAMLQEICAVMDIDERAPTKMSRAIGRYTAGKGGLLAIDEGQHLSSEALDQLRTLRDKYKFGIVVCGNPSIVSKLEGQRAANEQLYSRAGIRLRRPGARPADIVAMIEAWGIGNAEEAKLVTAVGKKPGALRNIDECLRLASMLAGGAGEVRTLKHIKAAWGRLAPDGGSDAQS